MSNTTITAIRTVTPEVTETVVVTPAVTELVDVELAEVISAFEDWARTEHRQFSENIDIVVELADDGTLVGRFALDDDDAHGLDNPLDLEEDNGNIECVSFDNGNARNEWIWERAGELGIDLSTDECDSVAHVFGLVITKLNERPGKRSYAVERYEHGQVRYSILGRGYQCQWDTAPGVAVLTLNTDNICGPDATDDEYDKAAQAILDEYTSWCNGDVYGVFTVTFDVAVDNDGDLVIEPTAEDSVWGLIGTEWAQQAVRDGDV